MQPLARASALVAACLLLAAPVAGEIYRWRDAQSPPAAIAPSGDACRAIQREIARKQAVIRTHQGSVEANQRWADDIDRSPFSRREYEVRAQEEARWLSRAEQELDRYVAAQRRNGVEPGCLP